MSKKRPVSEEDAALFRDAAGDVRVLDDDRAPTYRRHKKPVPRSRVHDTAPSTADAASTKSIRTSERDSEQLFVRPGLQQKHIRRLRRGQMTIEAEADLHGMRMREAEMLLKTFLDDCRREGLRCVRVIHGKGRGSRGGQAVLKWEVDRWLRQHEQVMAFSTAQPMHGGTGAVYVLLKA